MSDLMHRIDQKEIFVTIHPSHNRQLARELINLAHKGALYQNQINECADEIRVCCDESCRGRLYCKAYRAEVIE